MAENLATQPGTTLRAYLQQHGISDQAIGPVLDRISTVHLKPDEAFSQRGKVCDMIGLLIITSGN